MEKWALPFFKKAGFVPASICTAARTDIECAYCQACNHPGGLEPINSEPPYLDTQCSYTDEQRQEFHIVETWACPACASFSNENKLYRETSSREELLKVNWKPPWEQKKQKQSGQLPTSACKKMKKPNKANPISTYLRQT
eukprot:1148503-Pelagomonas_calceolata.AAC.1